MNSVHLDRAVPFPIYTAMHITYERRKGQQMGKAEIRAAVKNSLYSYEKLDGDDDAAKAFFFFFLVLVQILELE